MDILTIVVAVALVALGAGALWWPLSLILEKKDMEIQRLKTLVGATSDLVQTERTIDAARDLAPLDELGVLLDGDSLPGLEAERDART